ncbi:MAG TPA: serine hydrolase [Pirellulaceae bacterium]
MNFDRDFQRTILGTIIVLILGLGMWQVVDAQSAPAPPAAEQTAPLTWETLAERLDAEAADGFSGVALVVREGEIVLEKAYGLANREEKIDNKLDTVFAIGSTPIDFTKAGILLLAEQGKLKLGDSISRYFPDAPQDKRDITIEHLMQGRSGLRNFHDLPSDRDPDHGWIDREEAVRRILAQELLFPPGTKHEHSHSAWGLLAAILEIASGQSYPEFTRQHLFEPAGMKDTGFFGEPVPKERLAIGYGPRTDGQINAPPYWGKTSWLVMGSGGQVSTIRDMYRWITALREGKILSPASLSQYFGPPGSVLEGGDAYGFGIVYTEGPRDFMILISNDNTRKRRPSNRRMASNLAQLVNRGQMPKYSLGIAMAIDAEGRVTVDQVMPDSPAEHGGLQVGDILLSANGVDLQGDPRGPLREPLDTGAKIVFELERDGQQTKITVQPVKRP